MRKSLPYLLFSPFFKLFPVKARVSLLYCRRFKKFPDLENPTTFNEKIQVKKIRDRNHNITITADKLSAKSYAKQRVPFLKISETLWVASSKDEITSFDSFKAPGRYVVKSNYGSQDVIIVCDGKSISARDLLRAYGKDFDSNKKNALGEWGYENIPRKIFAESFIGGDSCVPVDYKFFVYHGSVYYIQVDTDRFGFHCRNFFDKNWNDIGLEYSHPRKVPPPGPPTNLDKMIEAAQVLGKDFDFVRVDLYSVDEDVYFGEMTHYPGSGFEKFPDQKWDTEFSYPWNML